MCSKVGTTDGSVTAAGDTMKKGASIAGPNNVFSGAKMEWQCVHAQHKQKCGTDLLLEFQEEPQLCADLASCHNSV